jgi:hypothetical protein
MPTEKELLDRIRQLEEQNGVLHDKLDMIWSILADEYETAAAEDDGESPPNLVQIDRKNH